MTHRIVTSLIVIACLSTCSGVAVSQTNKEGYAAGFEAIWKKVNETYFDTSFGGLDWRTVHDVYSPQIASAEDDETFYALVNKMLWELNVSHAALVPPGLLQAVEPAVFAPGGIGVGLRMLDGEAVITSVDFRSPAYDAGLRPGYVIQAVDSVPVAQIEKEVRRDMPPRNDRNRIAQVTKGIMGRIYGTPGAEVAVAYTDGRGETHQSIIARTKRTGVAVGPGGRLFMAIEFEMKRLDDGIGYVRLNTLQPQLAPQIAAAIKSMGDLSGLVFDLRGNSGGEIEGMADLFLVEKTLLFQRKTREGKSDVFSAPSDTAYRGPMVLLTDVTSGSASELLAASLQGAKRATVVGDRSPGSVTESDITILPGGAILMYPVAQLSTPDGVVLEGSGVVPDVEVALSREMLLRGADSQLEAAVRRIKQEKSGAIQRNK